jgi:hypothetical protein
MVRSTTFAVAIALAFFGSAIPGEAQTFVHRPNGASRVVPVRPQAHTGEVTRFSAQPIYPTRFHATPIYPRTTFWSTEYPNNIPAGQAYSLSDLANLGGPTYYPGTEIPFGRPDFDGMAR